MAAACTIDPGDRHTTAIRIDLLVSDVLRERYGNSGVPLLFAPSDPMASGDFLTTFRLISQSKALGQALVSMDFKPLSDLKCEKTAVGHRALGVKQMENGKLSFALKSMNLSVILSPLHTEQTIEKLPTTLSSAYNCRSQILFRMKKYHECISDVLHAMRRGCRIDEIPELFETQAVCCEHLNEFDKAAQCYREAMAVPGARLSAEKRKRLKQGLQNMDRRMRLHPDFAKSSRLHADFNPLEWKPVPPLQDGTHLTRPSLSRALEVKSFDAVGSTAKEEDIAGGQPALRSEALPEDAVFVAAKDIDAGSVLLVEKAFVWQFSKNKNILDHCSCCSHRCEVVTPCRGCAAVAYCCDECEEQAWDDFHHLECMVLPFFQAIPMKNGEQDCRPILRVLLRTLSKLISMSSRAKPKETTTATAYAGSNDSIFKLPSHQLEHFSNITGFAKIMILVSICTCLLQRILRVSSALEKCFPNRPANQSIDDNLKDVFKFGVSNITELLPCVRASFAQSTLADESGRNLIGALQVAFGVAILQHGRQLNVALPATDAGMPIMYVGRTFHPSATLFEPSCYPHAVSFSHGTTCVLRTVRHVRKGERVTIGHGSCVFPRDSYDVRRAQLGFLRCTCAPCATKMSAGDQVSTPALKCPQCGAPIRDGGNGDFSTVESCDGCGRAVKRDLAAFVADYNAAMSMLQLFGSIRENAPQLLERFLQIYVPLDRRMAEPHESEGHALCVSYIRKAFCMQGNYQQ